MKKNQWLTWAQKISALAQAGLTYSENVFDRDRYEQLQEIATEMISQQAGLVLEDVQGILKAEKGYPTPKVDVRGIVIRDGKILLVKEILDKGRWTVPGGWVDMGEPPSMAVEREVWEESGYEVKAKKLLAVYDRDLHGHTPYLFPIYKLFFLCEITGGEPTNSIETEGVAFFEKHNLPELSLGRVTEKQIIRFFDFMDHPEWPTDFD